jgi:hypothetical protein
MPSIVPDNAINPSLAPSSHAVSIRGTPFSWPSCQARLIRRVR